ncbi:T9SS type A sorting domain-containing protein [Flavobacterium sp. UMI-01]|uniref:T9SS type A sorting domain-containing protein n=1 Tax=Flavobacterium sp. UMI-01 TaxID=1441053 RepID=UPI001C7DAEE4|nr:T9SS type A sorting domain-containing protein [Flavobacterium sp. UMI-01]GIZ08996.1 hypothetical protein FUMI01_17230 [Flavobacterium sp. UMI-01]
MKSNFYFILLYSTLFTSPFFNYGQTVLSADGPEGVDTYTLINNTFGPNSIETPDLDGDNTATHKSFGKHITEIFDAILNKHVFNFTIHLNEDNDTSTNSTDRQRLEIKTHASSPANLKGISGETVRYKWKLKIPSGFIPTSNFTHIHQIKAVGGDDSHPIFAITLRKSSPSAISKLELNYYPPASSSANKLLNLDLSLFENQWVEITETITYGSASASAYNIIIKKLSDNTTIATYNNNTHVTIRADNTFARPKWGIYRSIASPSTMKDENLLFADFSIEELTNLGLDDSKNTMTTIAVFPNPVDDKLSFTEAISKSFNQYKIIDINGKTIKLGEIKTEQIDVSTLKTGNYFIQIVDKNKTNKTIQFLKK